MSEVNGYKFDYKVEELKRLINDWQVKNKAELSIQEDSSFSTDEYSVYKLCVTFADDCMIRILDLDGDGSVLVAEHKQFEADKSVNCHFRSGGGIKLGGPW